MFGMKDAQRIIAMVLSNAEQAYKKNMNVFSVLGIKFAIVRIDDRTAQIVHKGKDCGVRIEEGKAVCY